MKKSILSLSAAVALGGLGLVNSANAIIVYDNAGTDTTGLQHATDPSTGVAYTALATKMYQHPAGTGHILLVPYFSAQGNNATLINIVNTDTTNGKAVKVRFRGATNSDDVLDFTLLLSPGDVWSGSVQQGTDGIATIIHGSDETTCTLPAADSGDWTTIAGGALQKPFVTSRLPQYLTTAQQAALTREGYVEILNMADIIPDDADNSVFQNVLHNKGVAACGGKVSALLNTTLYNATDARTSYDLTYPSGGLMGSWAIMNQAQQGIFTGTQTAMVATSDTKAMGQNGTAATGLGALAFFAQSQTFFAPPVNIGSAGAVKPLLTAVTADPLLVGGVGSVSYVSPVLTGGTAFPDARKVAAQWYDLPDLSTPYIPTMTNPQAQSDLLTATLLKTNVVNEWIATASTGVPFDTDWVVSQPSRRYHVAVNYGTASGQSLPVWSDPVAHTLPFKGPTTGAASITGGYPGYADVQMNTGAYGPVACLQFSLGAINREEGGLNGGGFSPGVPAPTCGEVITLQFADTSPLAAALTTSSVAPAVAKVSAGAGWAQLNLTTTAAIDAGGVPMLGFAATQFSNTVTGAIYNETFTHRWNGVANVYP